MKNIKIQSFKVKKNKKCSLCINNIIQCDCRNSYQAGVREVQQTAFGGLPLMYAVSSALAAKNKENMENKSEKHNINEKLKSLTI